MVVCGRCGQGRFAGLGVSRVLAEVLVSSRQATGLTQEGLSGRSGVSVRTIRNLEAGVITSPRESTTELLLGALNARRWRGWPGGRCGAALRGLTGWWAVSVIWSRSAGTLARQFPEYCRPGAGIQAELVRESA